MDEHSLVIENECIPISTNEIQHMFEPLYRLGFSQSRDSSGNGLELYIVDTLFFTKYILGVRFAVRL